VDNVHVISKGNKITWENSDGRKELKGDGLENILFKK
jgi:hypothetical protein